MTTAAASPKKPHPNRYKVTNTSPNKGGRPSEKQILAQYKDEAKAFESIRDKWTLISHRLADEVLKVARNTKRLPDGKSFVTLATVAGIAYDKRWSKQTHDSTEIELPPALMAALTSKLATAPQGNQLLSTEVAHLTEECDLPTADSSPDPVSALPAADPGG
ncbi:MAG: hypothetical protein H0X01_01090 [Nitrospira sp.]|nr:hypothetical protein [Nitrospira sp.]